MSKDCCRVYTLITMHISHLLIAEDKTRELMLPLVSCPKC